jgi:hypothetical protein
MSFAYPFLQVLCPMDLINRASFYDLSQFYLLTASEANRLALIIDYQCATAMRAFCCQWLFPTGELAVGIA